MSILKTKRALYLFSLAALSAFLFLLIYSLTSKEIMTKLFLHTSYYLILLMMIVWTIQAVLFLKTANFSLKLLLKKHWAGILIALILTSLIFVSVQVGFKTLSDETNLLSVSMAMLTDKISANYTMGKYYYGNFNPINREIEKRPLVFPFLVSVLHTFTGFRYQNPFIFNFIIMFLFLSGVYIAARKFLDIPSSVAAMFFILSYPVFSVFGTSGNFDFFNSVFFAVILATVYCYLMNPSSSAFAFIFASLLVFSNIRYESIFFLLFIPLLLCKAITKQHLKDNLWLFFITPLVNLPYIWGRILKAEAYQNPEDVPVLSAVSFVKNIKIYFGNLVDLNYYLPYAGILSIISILIFTYLVAALWLKRKQLQKQQKYFLLVLLVSVLASTCIYFAHFFGDCTHPSSARFFITLSIVLAFGPIALKIYKPQFISGAGLLITAVIFFLFYHPIAVEGRFINSLKGNRTAYHCIDFLSKIGDKNILVIAERPGQFTALGYGAINFSYANKNSEQILREATRHLFPKVVVFQEVEYGSNNPTKNTTLPTSYKLNTLYDIQITATEFLRISEIEIPPEVKSGTK